MLRIHPKLGKTIQVKVDGFAVEAKLTFISSAFYTYTFEIENTGNSSRWIQFDLDDVVCGVLVDGEPSERVVLVDGHMELFVGGQPNRYSKLQVSFTPRKTSKHDGIYR